MTGTRSLIIVFALVLAASCAPKTAPPAASPTSPRYPEFVFPKAGVAMSGELLAQHETAWQQLQTGDLKAAERGFTQVAKRSPDVYPALTGLGYTALARKDHKAALEQFNRGLAAQAQYAPALVGRGQAYLAMGDPGRALESFDAAVAVDPTLAAVKHSADVLRLQVMQGGVGAARKAAQEGRLAEARAGYEQAIMTSPQSPFLFREIAVVELKDGRLPAALTHARKAVELEPGDPRNHIAVADVLEALGQVPEAVNALTAALALEPGEALSRRIESLRERATRAAMPEAYREIETSPAISRAQLAALIATHLGDVVARTPERGAALMTDVRDHWASDWILAVTRSGFMEVFPNHTFQPNATISRGDLALSVNRILNAIATGKPQLAAKLKGARRRFTDLPPGHLRHAAASVAVEAGVMAPNADGSFQLARPVTGAEALAAIARVRELAGTRQ